MSIVLGHSPSPIDEDSLPRFAHLRHNPPAQATLAFDAGERGGFIERTNGRAREGLEFHGAAG